jgi:radical SAM protein with 4Fe4S-binding SPASM domain
MDPAQLTARALRLARRTIDRMIPGADPAIYRQRPYELHIEFTNLCNANCVFCPYQFQTRPHTMMDEAVFMKAVDQFVELGGGPVDLTPIVGDALIHPKALDWIRHLRSLPQIDRIALTTNAILVRRHGAEALLDAGLSRLTISMAGFDEAMYRRVYRNDMYVHVRDAIYALYEANARRAEPVPIVLALRADRPRDEVLASPDFQPLRQYDPTIDFLERFSSSGGLITTLPDGMALDPPLPKPKRKPCQQTYLGLTVRSNGDVQACFCESSVNADDALILGNLESETLEQIWQGKRMAALRASFATPELNANCRACEQYYLPADFHSGEARRRARISRRRAEGEVVRHETPLALLWQLD